MNANPASAQVQPLRIFLCHASYDKPPVRELYDRLRTDGFDPWLDVEKLVPGQDWPHEITKTVRASDVVIVCLSHRSVAKSGFVQKEIRQALDVADEKPEGTIFLIPLRFEDCQVPERLQRWQRIDFFEKNGYEKLLGALQARGASDDPHSYHDGLVPTGSESLGSRVKVLMQKLRNVWIEVPLQPDINVVRILKALPRKGKLVRLRKHSIKIECRSVLDHIFSLAHTADVFLAAHIKHGLAVNALQRLASQIAYHDICEALIDDHADFTPTRRFPVWAPADLKEVEQAANKLIRPWMEPWLRRDFDAAMRMLEDPGDSCTKFLRILDKIDPIIGIWRYLHHFRGELDVANFLKAMDDFFSNPEVLVVCGKNAIDQRVCRIVEFLQTTDNARKYCSDRNFLDEIAVSAGVPRDMPRRLIEGRKLQFASSPPKWTKRFREP
jgi:5'-deoxynucleotidase YfbR-like HD superfamily hydrolase